MTIHKSQGGTFNEVVYEYQRTPSLPLLYVALSRVTSIERLYIVPKDNDNRLYHGRKNDTSIISLQDEFRRLSLNTLSTIGRTILDDRKKLSMVTFNCQSLRKQVSVLSNPVTDSSNILFLSETWSNDDENVDIPNFNCVAKFKLKNIRLAEVAIYQKSNDASNTVTSNMGILLRYIREIDIGQSSIGDICAAHCVLDDGTNIIMVVVYISPNNTINNIIKFLYKRLMICCRLGSEEYIYIYIHVDGAKEVLLQSYVV
ncbi:ATP-dependent DNA helicase [Trichonephila inaurata madagascariensis]|uniref:ATP-dependent DNA helicase n=1 Tax=Trichonephila inaurata madagascariensis TaxID=2747483 RepID=A0A8X7C5M7_9ARAC|nr:ATP-dependent DNA helicase [Trichonephila inaurata madagascariensis]